MKEYYFLHKAVIHQDRCYVPGTFVLHIHEQMSDSSRMGIKENYLFDGFSIKLFIFELKIGVKIYEVI